MKSRLPLLSVAIFLPKPCFSQQVFYGSRRLAGGISQRSGAFQTMQPAWEPQSGCGARIGQYGQKDWPLERLEACEGNLSRTVLRGA